MKLAEVLDQLRAYILRLSRKAKEHRDAAYPSNLEHYFEQNKAYILKVYVDLMRSHPHLQQVIKQRESSAALSPSTATTVAVSSQVEVKVLLDDDQQRAANTVETLYLLLQPNPTEPALHDKRDPGPSKRPEAKTYKKSTIHGDLASPPSSLSSIESEDGDPLSKTVKTTDVEQPQYDSSMTDTAPAQSSLESMVASSDPKDAAEGKREISRSPEQLHDLHSGSRMIQTRSLPTMLSAAIASRNTAKACWVTIDANVYDITAFLGDHPGSGDIILKYGGEDVGDIMRNGDSHTHSEAAYEILHEHHIGYVKELSNSEVPPTESATEASKPAIDGETRASTKQISTTEGKFASSNDDPSLRGTLWMDVAAALLVTNFILGLVPIAMDTNWVASPGTDAKDWNPHPIHAVSKSDSSSLRAYFFRGSGARFIVHLLLHLRFTIILVSRFTYVLGSTY